jgi:hypothetical protein
MTATDRPTDMGHNRTGLAMSPLDAPAMIEAAALGTPHPDAAARGLAGVRLQYAAEAGPIGKMPPPASLRGLFGAAVEAVRGHKSTVLLDKLAERLAFERTGVRLYDGLIAKLTAKGSWDGGPTLADLLEYRSDEAAHFVLVEGEIKRLGADPTAVTPSADLVGVEGMGLVQVITDPRTTLAQALHAQAVAELVDVACWEQLAALVAELGDEETAAEFRKAQVREVVHREAVLGWLRAHTELTVRGELADPERAPTDA